MSHHLHIQGRENRKRLKIVLGLVLLVMILEVAGGLWSGSLALLADAGHMLSDAAALALALFASWFAQRPAPKHRTYGYYRIEILAALVNAVLLVLVMVFVVREALARLREPEPMQAGIVLGIGFVGLAVNVVAIRLLHAPAGKSLNVRGAYLEVVADALGSLGVLVAAGLTLGFGFVRADPIVSLGIALLIAPRIALLLRDVTDVLMETAPRHVDVDDVRATILGRDGVLDVHDLHVWTITSGRVMLSAHVVTGAGIDRDAVIADINAALRSGYGLEHTTLQVEGVEAGGSGDGAVACEPCP